MVRLAIYLLSFILSFAKGIMAKSPLNNCKDN